MKKVKAFMLEHKVFFTVLFVLISLLGLEYVIVNNYVDKKTNPKKNKSSNIASNINDLDSKQKKVLGIASNSNQTKESENSKTNSIVEDKKEEKLNEISNSNINKKYLEYENKTDEEKKNIDVIPSKEKVDISELKEINKNNKSVFPEKYDLSKIISFNYKGQGSYGLCWNFASTRVFESYLELRDKKHYNFSEIVVDYLSSYLVYNNERELHEGGNFVLYKKIVDRLGGLIDEKDVEQGYEHDYTYDEYTNFLNLPKVKIEGYEVVAFPYLYYDESENKFYGEGVISDEQLEEYRNAMKNHIMNNSALYGVIHTLDMSIVNERIKDKSMLPQGEYATIDSSDTIYCTSGSCQGFTDHAITIVGWDDNFDRRAFRNIDKTTGEIKYAEHDGAFIALDSRNDSKTYIYISYEYPSLYSELYGIKSFDTTTGYDLTKIHSNDLKNYLIEEFEKSIVYLNDSIYLPYSKIEDTTFLSLENMNLTEEDLNFLRLFTNIEYLDISKSTIPSLNFLQNYSNIESLSIEDSSIGDISVLSNLTNLTVLDLSNDNISDISAIGGLTKLETLSLANNNIKDISVIKNFNKLETLDLDNNKIIVEPDLFDNLVELKVLSLRNCGISSLKLNSNILYQIIDISGNTNIQLANNISVYNLFVDNANLSSLEILTKVDKDKLYSLSASYNNITDVSILSSFDDLLSVDLSYNKNIDNFNPIISLFKPKKSENTNNITTFFYGFINIMGKKYDEEHIEVEDDEGIYYEPGTLYLNGCNISDITMFNNLNIDYLELAYNNITSVENFENDNVVSLDLSNNNLENSDLSPLFKNNMNYLYLSNSKINNFNYNIDIDNIDTLDLSYNDITDISSLKNTEIQILSLEGNTHFKNYPKDMVVYYLNLSDTNIDEDLIDNLNMIDLISINISSNTSISDYASYIDKMSKRAANLGEEYKDSFIGFDVLLKNESLSKVIYSDYIEVYSNYEIATNSLTDTINLLTTDYMDLFKLLLNARINKYNNVELDRTLTKLKVKDLSSSYIEYNKYLGYDSSLNYRISFK